MKVKVANIAFVILFMALLLLPLLRADFSGGKTSQQERRVLAVRPPLQYMTQNTSDFIKQFDAWFSDNLGLREPIVTLYNKLNSMYSQGYYLDGESVVFIGKEGHHFHSHYNQITPIYQGKPWLNEQQLKDLSNGLNEIDQYLSSKGIPVIYMIATDKESVYWEYYPDFVIRGPEPSSLDKVVDYLEANANIDMFCIKERLLQKKKNHLVFPKTGDIYELCHYNETGSFFAYQELMEHVGTYFPNIVPFAIEDVDITYRNNGSSSVTLKQQPHYKMIEPRFFKEQGTMEFVNDDLNLPTILLLYDSYSAWFPKYLPEHFGRTIMHHWNTIERLEAYIDLYKPDIVVFESAERAIPGFANAIISYNVRLQQNKN